MANFESVKMTNPYGIEDTVLKLSIDSEQNSYRLSNLITEPDSYVFVIWHKTNTPCTISINVFGEIITSESNSQWTKVVKVKKVSDVSNKNIDITPPINSTTFFYEAYLSRGTIDTSWSPAPEDIDDNIESVKSEFTQTAEEIKMSVKNIKGDVSNINIQIGKIEQSVADNKGSISSITTTVDGIKNTVDKHGESISEIDQKADKISQQVTDVESNLSSKIELTAGEITQKVDAVESGLNSKITQTAGEINQKIEDTKTNLSSEIKQTSDKITQSVNDVNKNLSTRIDQTSNEIQLTAKNLKDNYYNKEETNAKFKIQSDSITSTVKKEVITQIGNIEIGGRNLLLDTRDFGSKSVWVGNRPNPVKDTDGMSYVGVVNTWSKYLKQRIDLLEDIYTLSFYAKASSETTLEVRNDNAPIKIFHTVNVNSVDWKRYLVSVEVDYEHNTELTFFTRAAETIYIKGIKLEKGNKATDWTPAPEDMATADSLADVNNSLTNTTNNLQSNINSTNKNLQDVQNSQKEVYEIVSENKIQISSLTQRAEGFQMDFKTVNETVKQLNNQFVTERDERYKYIKFIDGEIWLGKEVPIGEDDFKLVIKNDRISFLQNKTEVAYMSNNKLYVTDIHVTSSLQLGKFVLSSRANGNVGLRWIGN